MYLALGHCVLSVARWWPCDMWVTGAEGVPVPKRPRGLSLPLVAMHWAQLLGGPDGFFAIQIVCRLFRVHCLSLVCLGWQFQPGWFKQFWFRLVAVVCFRLF